MRKYFLAAATLAAMSCFAAPAMACGGDQELTINPDGTTTCGTQEAPIAQGVDVQFNLPEDAFMAYDLTSVESISVADNGDHYELTMVLYESAPIDGAMGADHVAQAQTVTTTVWKDSGQVTTTTTVTFGVRVGVTGPRGSVNVTASTTRTSPRTVSSTSTSSTSSGGGAGGSKKQPPAKAK
jgi:hypothetical protein